MRTSLRRLIALAGRRRRDADLAEEIRDHLERRAQQLVDDGMDPREAAAAARRMFGNVTAVREETREAWGFRWLDAAAQDLRYGCRVLRRAPLFAAATTLSLAVGIAAVTTIFGLADAVLLRRLPVRAPHELHSVGIEVRLGGAVKKFGASAALLEAIGAAAAPAVTGFIEAPQLTLVLPGGATRLVDGHVVADRYFDVAGAEWLVAPARTTAAPGVILTEPFWASAFRRDRSAVGSTISLNGTHLEIAGVVRSFRGLSADRPADLFVPAAVGPAVDPAVASTMFRAVLRLPDRARAAALADRIGALFLSGQGAMLRGADVRVTLDDASRGISDVRSDLARPVWIGLALAAMLLVVACANAGGLLLGRYAARRGEFAVRMALGAGRQRLLRQVIIEALLVAVLAGSAGMLAARVAGPVVLRALPVVPQQAAFDVHLDWRLAAFAAIVSALSAIGAAAASVARIRGLHPVSALAGAGRTLVAGRRRTSNALIVAQIACALVLLAGAAAATRTLRNLSEVDPGFDVDRLLAVTVDASASLAAAQPHAHFARLLDRLAGIPLVEAATLVQVGLLSGAATTGTVDVGGFTPAADEDRYVRLFWVGPRFFETTGMRIRHGQPLGAADHDGRAKAAVVNEAFARFYFERPERAIGRIVNRDVTIVGVVADAHYDALRQPSPRAMFVPFSQAPPRPRMTALVRVRGEALSAAAAIGTAARQFDPRARVASVSLERRLADTLSRERFVAGLGALASAIAIFLACAGLYASVACAVAERRAEIAMRMALGATRRDVARLVLHDPARIAVAGLLAGLAGTGLLMRSLETLLFGVAALDVTAWALCAAALLTVMAIAALVPARRALAIDPQVWLRCP